ncbi:MAG: alanine racemase, partial [Aureibaculum sp.]
VNIVGLMGMASFTENMVQVKEEFTSLNNLFQELKLTDSNISILSIGMSGDYPIAIDSGSNMVRIGSAIFGSRN